LTPGPSSAERFGEPGERGDLRGVHRGDRLGERGHFAGQVALGL
jgi:hypothetical protein